MEHDQEILGGSRSASAMAIFLIWSVEALFVTALIGIITANTLGLINWPTGTWRDPEVVMICVALVLFSFILCAMAVSFLANTIANIDARNFQHEQLILSLQQEQKQNYIAPARTQRSVDMDTMRIRPERVT